MSNRAVGLFCFLLFFVAVVAICLPLIGTELLPEIIPVKSTELR